jgi:hypothetical protein
VEKTNYISVCDVTRRRALHCRKPEGRHQSVAAIKKPPLFSKKETVRHAVTAFSGTVRQHAHSMMTGIADLAMALNLQYRCDNIVAMALKLQ